MRKSVIGNGSCELGAMFQKLRWKKIFWPHDCKEFWRRSSQEWSDEFSLIFFNMSLPHFPLKPELVEEHLLQCYGWRVESSVRDICRREIVGWVSSLLLRHTVWRHKYISQYATINEQESKFWPNNGGNPQQPNFTSRKLQHLYNSNFQRFCLSIQQKTSNSWCRFQSQAVHESCTKHAAVMEVSETDAFFVEDKSAFLSGVRN